MNNVYVEGLSAIAPEIALTIVSLAALVYDLVSKGRESKRVGYLTLVGLAVTAWMLFGQWGQPGRTVFGMVAVDAFGNFFKLFTESRLPAPSWTAAPPPPILAAVRTDAILVEQTPLNIRHCVFLIDSPSLTRRPRLPRCRALVCALRQCDLRCK